MSLLKRMTVVSLTSFSLALLSINAIAQEVTQMVSVEQAKQQHVTPTVWLPGNVVNRSNARISTEQNGRLTWILDVGAKVNKGDPLAKLDARHLDLQLAEKQAQFRQQKINADYLKKQQKRLRALIDNNSTARAEFDRTEKDLHIANEALGALEIQAKQIELAIEKATIKAPFAGKINRRLVQQGEYVTMGMPLVQLVDPNTLDITIAAPLSVAPYLSANNEVLVKFKDKLLTVPVRTWSPAGDSSSRTFEVKLNASQYDLFSGLAVTASLPNEKAVSATLVPRDALILREKETYVIAVDTESNARKIRVSVGRGIGEWVSVEGKVSAGDKLVVRGGERLEDGQKVRINQPEVKQGVENIAAN
ncbi:efflux RND transporter periplasmic adaptor subunit [Aliikangiella coralliicola]|nr:efflux RND transporter periplasmic adaptor subunit [Aliikangiella coralliicola]